MSLCDKSKVSKDVKFPITSKTEQFSNKRRSSTKKYKPVKYYIVVRLIVETIKSDIANVLLTSPNFINVIVRKIQVLNLFGTGNEIKSHHRHCIVR